MSWYDIALTATGALVALAADFGGRAAKNRRDALKAFRAEMERYQMVPKQRKDSDR